MTHPQRIELLSPARNANCGIDAINCGADAVYIGASHFSARAEAANQLDDIARLTDYAHQFGAKVYVALNTILYDNELARARQLALDLSSIGVDALITQDMALLRMDLPLPLHASTQTDNRTSYWLANCLSTISVPFTKPVPKQSLRLLSTVPCA